MEIWKWSGHLHLAAIEAAVCSERLGDARRLARLREKRNVGPASNLRPRRAHLCRLLLPPSPHTPRRARRRFRGRQRRVVTTCGTHQYVAWCESVPVQLYRVQEYERRNPVTSLVSSVPVQLSLMKPRLDYAYIIHIQGHKTR